MDKTNKLTRFIRLRQKIKKSNNSNRWSNGPHCYCQRLERAIRSGQVSQINMRTHLNAMPGTLKAQVCLLVLLAATTFTDATTVRLQKTKHHERAAKFAQIMQAWHDTVASNTWEHTMSETSVPMDNYMNTQVSNEHCAARLCAVTLSWQFHLVCSDTVLAVAPE